MKRIVLGLKRNQVFDVISNLKKFVREFDNNEKPGRYFEIMIFVTDDVGIFLRLDRAEIYPEVYRDKNPKENKVLPKKK